MTLFTRNVDLGAPVKLSAFRKVAIGTWRTCGDPSVYSTLEVDVTRAQAYIEKLKTQTGQKITLTHFVGKVAAEVLKTHPELNCILRWGRIYPRNDVDVFFQVASDAKGEDLSGTTIRQADRKSIAEMAREMTENVRTIREKGDPAFKQMKRTMKGLPGWATGWAIGFSSFLMYLLNIWTPLLGTPRDPFGSIMITSIGPIGLDNAFAPLVPYSRVPALITVGAVRDTPVARNGQVVIAPVVQLCVTFDHRLIDGVHGSHMARTLRKIFEDPEKWLG